MRIPCTAVCVAAVVLANAEAGAELAAPTLDRGGAAAAGEPRARKRSAGSLWSSQALGAGNQAMSMGGGVAVLLPYYGFEAGAGLGERLDVVGRFETVLGILHYPYVGLRFMPFELGSFRVGLRWLTHYSFFGISTDKVNLTSTFYSSLEAGISAPVGERSQLTFAAGGELDWFEHRVIEGDGEVVESVRYDATNLRAVLLTGLTADLDGYLQGKLRIPTETLIYEAMEFYVIPFIEIGGTWSL
jgi:hypothetical protein